jgi:ubiquinone/menaquinone biosynthesis C-methylase UbiE
VPCGPGDLEIEMARANPRARILCLHAQWNTLLEARRRGREAKADNRYFARGSAILLPVQDQSVAAVWSADGFHRYTAPELAMTQMARVLKPGGFLAGASLVKGGPEYVERLIVMSGQRLPGRRDEARHLQLLAGSGFGEVHAYRDGGYLRVTGMRE